MQFHNSEMFETRRVRREAIKNTIRILCFIRDAEQTSLNNTPANFQSTESFENGEYAVDTLNEVIDMLADVY